VNYIDLLKQSSDRFNSIVCLGLDPILEDIPLNNNSPFHKIKTFYQEILNKIIQKNIYPAAVKPNYAFYAQYGIEGIQALLSICEMFKSEGLPIILDVKRGDIGTTAAAYAKESFQFFKADAVTLSPFLGFDSIAPFIENYPNKGYYILNKTSNQSSNEIQDLVTNGTPLYLIISQLIVQWYHPGIGAVVGATYPEHLNRITDVFLQSQTEIPYLIPGIGAQGGNLEEVIKALKRTDIRIHRFSSSRSINYAYKKHTHLNFSDAAVKELSALNNEINRLIG